MKLWKTTAALAGLVAGLFTGAAGAQPIGSDITYQGELSSGGWVVTGTADLKFRLYTAETGGTQVGPELLLANATLPEGRFTVELDFGAGAFGAEARWLEIEVRSPAGSGVYELLTPRQRATAAPASLFATQAGGSTRLDGQEGSFYRDASNLNAGTLPGSLLSGSYGQPLTFDNPGNAFTGSGAGLSDVPWAGITGEPDFLTGVSTTLRFAGMGTSASPLELAQQGATTGQVLKWDAGGWDPADDGLTLPFVGSTLSTPHALRVTNSGGGGLLGRALVSSGDNSAVAGENFSERGVGVEGRAFSASGVTYGGRFISESTSGTGVLGEAGATSGITFGVFGRSHSPGSRAVWGVAESATGDTIGVYGHARSPTGHGVFGETSATTGVNWGVRGQSNSLDGRGVFGIALSGSGNNKGVLGETQSTSGQGVVGVARAVTGSTVGVWGETYSPNGRGVYGFAVAASGNNIGVHGRTHGTQDCFGVIGEALGSSGMNTGVLGHTSSPQGYGVYFQNRLAGTGTKSFQMDHPLDPENKYLNHFCTEAPEPLNAYSGNVVTDNSGYATVTLPDYFSEINTDIRYQLTVIDDSPNDFIFAKVSREVEGNSFEIRTSLPSIKVSWRIEGVRNDLWVRRYGFQAEQEKPEGRKGKYLSPELYNRPEDQGIFYHPATQTPAVPAPAEKP